MNLLLVFGMILGYTILDSDAYIGTRIIPEDPAHPGQCLGAVYPSKNETYHDVGSNWKSGACEGSACRRRDAQTLEIKITGCTPFAYPPHCEEVPEDPSKPFPQCCPTARCSGD